MLYLPPSSQNAVRLLNCFPFINQWWLLPVTFFSLRLGRISKITCLIRPGFPRHPFLLMLMVGVIFIYSQTWRAFLLWSNDAGQLSQHSWEHPVDPPCIIIHSILFKSQNHTISQLGRTNNNHPASPTADFTQKQPKIRRFFYRFFSPSLLFLLKSVLVISCCWFLWWSAL